MSFSLYKYSKTIEAYLKYMSIYISVLLWFTFNITLSFIKYMYNFIITVGVQRQYMRLIRENDTYSLNILNFTMIVRVRMHTTV